MWVAAGDGSLKWVEEDRIDFPVSASFLAYFEEIGMVPNYGVREALNAAARQKALDEAPSADWVEEPSRVWVAPEHIRERFKALQEENKSLREENARLGAALRKITRPQKPTESQPTPWKDVSV